MSCTSTSANSAIFTLSRFVSDHLDDPQRKSLYHSLKKAATRWEPSPQNPTVDEWKMWLSETSERVRLNPDLPSYAKSRVISRLDKARFDEPPKGSDFAAMKYFDTQIIKSKYALKDQASQISAWIGVPMEDVQAKVKMFREEYLALPRSQRPATPREFTKGFKQTSPNAPKDEATIYAHWRASDPNVYETRKNFDKYVSFDLETTGFSTKDCYIIEIGAVFYDSEGNETERWESFIRPPVNAEGVIDTGPTDIHNIFPKDVENAPTFADLADEIEQRFSGACVIGHNVGFDTKHLRAALTKNDRINGRKRQGDPWLAAADTYWEAARRNTDLPNSKLSTVAESLGVPYTDGHRALHDAVVCGDVFFVVKGRNEAK